MKEKEQDKNKKTKGDRGREKKEETKRETKKCK
jgi:hypothetical protein